METLGLVHGDLDIDGNGDYLLFSGVDRIRQDLTLNLVEVYGSDRFHPLFGSVLQNYVGNPITPILQQQVISEVNRVVQNYLTVQQNAVLQASVYGLTTYDTSDVVQSVGNIQASTSYDTIYVSATLTTVDQQTVTVTRQVGSNQ
jgi:hypothetical protein